MHSSDEMTENGPNHMVLLDIKLKCQGILKSEIVESQATVKQISLFFYLILTSTRQKPNDFATLDSTTTST